MPGGLGESFVGAPFVFDKGKADLQMDELVLLSEKAGIHDALQEVLTVPHVSQVVQAIFGASPYLTRLILKDPDRLLSFIRDDPEVTLGLLKSMLDEQTGAGAGRGGVMRALRQYKSSIALLTALGDLGGVWPVMKVTQVLSSAADFTLSAAIRFLFDAARESGDYLPHNDGDGAGNSGYFIIAMGKHGACELNYSSDIDLIVFYEAGRARLREGLGEQAFFIRLTRDLVKLMQEPTEGGYVFRMDLRLRPDPGATQVALSTDAAHHYYENFGQNWERAAMIKARVVAGDVNAGEKFLSELEHFVWRKYLDYASIADIHAMKRQIHAHKGFGELAVAGHNIKVGRGGIREIEFFAQTQQLIAGGRQDDLRVRGTLEALVKLVERNWIEEPARVEIEAAYLFLRMVEHRLQMLHDEQTQLLPKDEEGLLCLARFCGFETFGDFEAALRNHLISVQSHYGALFENVPELSLEQGNLVFTGGDDDPQTIETLGAMGFKDPPRAISIVRGWHFGRYPAMKSETARERLTEFQPVLLDALGKTSDPDFALRAFDDFLSALPAGVQLFSLLRSNTSLLRLVADIMGTAPRLARIMTRRRSLLEAVLDPGFFGAIPSEGDIDDLVMRELDEIGDYQDGLERMRIIGKEQSFLTGVRILSGTVSAEEAGLYYAAQAGALIRGCHALVEDEVKRAHGEITGGSVAIIAMGKLGGAELSAASDVDLITVYDFDDSTDLSDGPRPLHGSAYFARFTQRLIAALSSPMAEGRLYEVDMRLRPSGNAGPVATRFGSFEAYQRETAWTWEHMALTRARVISGPDALKENVENVIRSVLTARREKAQIADDVRDMRRRIEDDKGSTDLWNLKQVRGGLVDLEFISQFLQLAHAHENPALLKQNSVEAFQALRRAGILDEEQGEALVSATRLLHSLSQVLRLCLDEPFNAEKAPQGLKSLLCRASDMPDFSRLEGSLREAQLRVAQLFDELVQ